MVAQVDAATAAEAREHRQLAPLAAARRADGRGRRRRRPRCRAPAARRRRPGHVASPRRRSRPRARSSAGSRATTTRPSGAASRDGWAALEAPYDVALARWRQAEAMLASGGRAVGPGRRAQAPLLEAAELGARARGAKPLAARAARAGRPGPDRAARARWTTMLDATAAGRRAADGAVVATGGRRGSTARRTAAPTSCATIAGDPARPARGPTRSG